ncbi:hypothetical protein BKA70DRAFT_1220532 [Coprinopsis sp. MPI-PUGE-AT-0042]|nr:hypothetical protein BKA70DRAFT_1220532 [Coprinopsis sp. MPI-PUGE-AT-0042]
MFVWFNDLVSSVKRRIPTRSSSQKVQQRQEKPQASAVPQAPDLRRLSDFVNPFPHVGYGGYTKYYQATQADFPAIWSLNNMHAPQKQPQQQQPPPPPPPPSKPYRTSTRGSFSTSTRTGHPRNRRLSDIPEAPSEAVTPSPSSNQLRIAHSTSSQQSKTLRRSERRVIRSTSVTSTNSSSTPSRSTSATNLDRTRSTSSSSHSVMTSTTSSSTTNVSSYFDRAASTESHSTSPTDESESVLTPSDEQTHDAHFHHVAYKEKKTPTPTPAVAPARPLGQRGPPPVSHLRPPRRPMKTYVQPSDESDFDTDDDSDDDPVDWRATFYTAKSSLSDM